MSDLSVNDVAIFNLSSDLCFTSTNFRKRAFAQFQKQ